MAQYFNNFNPVDYEQVTYLRKKRKCDAGKFRSVSVDYLSTSKECLLSSLLDCSKDARNCFKILHKEYDVYTGLSTNKTKTNAGSFSRGYTELNSLGLVRKVKRGIYIINPRMYITYNLYESLCLLWDSL